MSYQETIRLNTELEALVNKRTQSLLEANKTLQKRNETLREMSIKDTLTHIFNRLYFERKIDDLIARFGISVTSLHLCIFDLDFFKKINDTYGHNQGDETLITTVYIASEILSKDSVFARIGGEEFAIIFIDKDDDYVLSIIEKIREKFAEESNKKTPATTGSFGLAKYSKNMTTKAWFIRADKALYRAKENGRNRVEHDFY